MKTKICLIVTAPVFWLLLTAVNPTLAQFRAELLSFGSERLERRGAESIVTAVKAEATIENLSPAAPGDLDPMFGNGGKVITVLPDNNRPHKVTIQPDGKIVVLGGDYDVRNFGSFLIRYNPNGTLDNSFGTGGMVLIPYTTPSFEYFSDGLAILPDGKILVSGHAGFLNDGLAVFRFNSNGSRDTSFGVNGVVAVKVGNFLNYPKTMKVQPDGKIIAIGNLCDCDGYYYPSGIGMARFNTDGSIDTTFGANGQLIILSSTAIQFEVDDAAVLPDGKLLLIGTSYSSYSYPAKVFLSRINANGTLDVSFGRNGILLLELDQRDIYVSQVALQADGKIVFPAINNSSGNTSSTIVRLNPDGTFDPSFGMNGKVVIPESEGYFGNSVSIQPNGKILAAGAASPGNLSHFAIIRLNADGSRETTFGSNGIAVTLLASDINYVVDMALQSDGKLVAYGIVSNSPPFDYNIGLARYVLDSPTPTPPQTLTANGKIAFTSNRDGNPEIYSINPDGTDIRRLTFNHGMDDYPAWSPNGIKIAYLSESAFGQHAIKIMNANGSGQQIVTPVVFDLSTPNFCGERFSLSWSPDGSKIAFQEFGHIVSVNVDGTNRQNITNTLVKESEPSWGRTGLIAYASTLSGGDGIHGLDIRTTDGYFYAHYGYFTCSTSPALSPDGTKLAYVHSNDFPPPGYITITPVEFHSFETLEFTHFVGVMNVRWSPDGNYLVFTSLQHRTLTVEIVDQFGQGRRPLTQGANPSWQPLVPTSCPNPIDCAEFLVRQHYLDFLSREPDAGGLAYWTDQIAQCGQDVRCIHERRIGVSAAFFVEMEFQDTGYYIYRFYQASFGRQPNYTEFTSDRSKVIGGTNLEANKQAFADEWVQRPAFVAAYPITMSNTEVVNKLFDSAGLTASRYDPLRQQEILAMNAGRSRALVLRDVIEIPDFKNIPNPNDPRYSELKQVSQYNPAFVLMQYFGYLRRNVDAAGYAFWLDVVNNREPNNYQGMVCAFITSTEYQLRFGSTVTRSNADCAP